MMITKEATENPDTSQEAIPQNSEQYDAIYLSYNAADYEYFQKRAIPPEFAAHSGVKRLSDHELRDVLNFEVSLTLEERKGGMTGLYFPTVCAMTGTEKVGIWKPDQVLENRKYVRRKGDANTAFFPHTTTRKLLEDSKTEIWICESPAKALALASAFELATEKAVAIGLNGVNGGWSRRKNDAGESTGQAVLNEDLADIPWLGRRVYLLFDNDVGSKKHVLAFQKSVFGGAIGAEHQLCRLLRARGAEAWIVEIPYSQRKVGIDDALAIHLKGVAGDLNLKQRKIRHLVGQLRGARVVERDLKAILARPEAGAMEVIVASDLRKEQVEGIEEIVGSTLLVRGGVTLISAPAKFGKSLVCMNLCMALESGEPFLGMFSTKKVPVLYVNYELPKTILVERVKRLGLETTVFFSPEKGTYGLNTERRKMSGIERLEQNAFYLMEMERTIQKIGAEVLIADPLGLALDGEETDPIAMKSVVENLHHIAKRNRIAALLVHHNRKSKQGEHFIDTASGHSNLVRYVDSVISGSLVHAGSGYRFRLDFALRAAAVDPLELHWKQPRESLKLSVAAWRDGGVGAGRSSELLSIFEEGDSVTSKEVQKELGIPKYAVTRLMSDLVSEGKARKVQRGLWLITGTINKDGA